MRCSRFFSGGSSFQSHYCFQRSFSSALKLQESDLTPKQVMALLNTHIVGQEQAKKSMAIALRNRWRRRMIESIELSNEIMPKNILMVGPTGVGKTEIARRLAKLVDAPFIKVEATRYTEVGFHGKDVDTMVKDLVEVAINQVRTKKKKENEEKIAKVVEDRLLDALLGRNAKDDMRESYRELLKAGSLEETEVNIVLPTQNSGVPFDDETMKMMNNIMVVMQQHTRDEDDDKKGKKMKIKDARSILTQGAMEEVVSDQDVVREALKAVQSDGIIVIDEIDKVCTPKDSIYRHADASSEGVQRDLLPIVEGTTITTKHGQIDTSKILFIASGAFHSSKPSDLLAELQGRLPIRVTLSPLTENDLYKILTETEHNLIDQHCAMLKTENVNVIFEDAAKREVARVSFLMNMQMQNIGARRLHAVLEKVFEDVSFECTPGDMVVDVEFVKQKCNAMMEIYDLHKFII